MAKSQTLHKGAQSSAVDVINKRLSGSGAYQFFWMSPQPKGVQSCAFNDTIHFRLCLRTFQSTSPHDFVVRLWTNLFHKKNNEGEWHAAPMPYLNVFIKSDRGEIDYLYGVDLTTTCTGHYGFNYRVVSKMSKKAGKSPFRSELEVRERTVYPPLTEWIQYPWQAKITSNIWIGNHAAALEAFKEGYDCLLNAADDAPVFVMQLNRPLILRKFPITSGPNNIIADKKLHTIVRWLWEASLRCNKVLVFSKYGEARAISILIAYIFSKNPDLTFSEAVKFVDSRSPGYFHKGLKAALERLYPRG